MDYSNKSKEELVNELAEMTRKYEFLLSGIKSDQQSIENSIATERWMHAIENTTDGLWDWNLVTNKVFFSRQWKAMLGFEDNEIGDSLDEWSKRVLPEDLDATIEKVEKHIKGETDFYESEHRLICKNGEVKWILDRGKIIALDNGTPTRMVGTHTDINQQKRKEIDLVERQKELRCHNQITDILSNTGAAIDEVFQKIVQIIPPAWQFPDFTTASIKFNDQCFCSDKDEETNDYLEDEIVVGQQVIGNIRVYCRVALLPYHEHIFLVEEKVLLHSIAERISIFIEKKQIEEGLQGSEIKFRNLIEQISDVIYNIDEFGIIRYISPSIEKVIGYFTEEIIGKNFLNFVGENERFLAQRLAMLSEGHEISNEYKLVTKTGSDCWIRLATKPIFSDGKFTGGIGTLIDITHVKQAQLSLQKSEETYRRLTEAINEVIYEISLDGVIKYISPAFEKITGYAPQEVTGINVFQLIHPDDNTALKQRLSLDAIPDPPFFDLRFIAKDGSIKWARSFPSIVYEKGEIVGRTGILTDITTQKKIETELKESEELYRSIIQTSPDAITITDLNGFILFTSPKSHQIFGLNSSQDYLSHFVTEFISPVDRERALRNFERIAKEKVGAIEYQALRKDGSEPYIEITPELIPDAEGNPSKILFISRDITEKKLAEEKVRQSEVKFRNLIETISDVIYEVDLSGNLLYVSPSSERVLGYKAEEVIGTNIFKYIYPEDHAFIKNSLASLESRKERYIEYRYVTKDGDIKWVRSATSAKYEDGIWVGGIGSLTDITDAKNSELELLKLSRAVEQSPVSIVITNLEGNIEYANPKACETTGYDLSELVGKNPRVLKSGETPPQEYEYLWDSISHGNVWRGIFHNKRKNGDFYWESSQITPIINAEKQITHYLAIKEDITERKGVQEALTKSENRFSRIAEQTQTVIWETNSEGVYTYVSPAAKSVWGYEPGDLIAVKHFWDIHPDKGKKEFINACFEDIKQLHPFKNMESPILRKDGKTGIMLTNGVPVLDQEGNLLGYCGSSNDITEQKAMTLALLDSEQRYRSIFQDSKSVMLLLDPETGFIVDANLSACSFYGWSNKELCSKKINEINTLPPAEIKIAMKRTIRQEQQHHFFKHRLSNGQIRDVEVFSGPTKFGDKTYLFSIVHDVTERWLAEEALKQRESDLLEAQEIANMGSWSFDLVTNKLSWSDNLYRLFDVDATQIKITQAFYFDLIAPEYRYLIDEAMEEMLVTKKQVSIEVLMNLKSGRSIWVKNTIVPYFEGENLILLKGTGVDITDKKATENQIRYQNERLNAIIEAIPDLIFVIDKFGTYLEVFSNEQEKLLIKPELIIGSTLDQAFDHEKTNLFLSKINEAIDKNTTITIDYQISLPESPSTDFEARIVPIDDEKVLIFSRDVTEKVLREKELNQLSMAVRQSPVITVVTDLNANVEYVNPAFEQITGYKLQEVVGKNVRILQSGKTDRKIYKNLWETILAGKTWHGEWMNRKKSGELYWEDVLISPITNEAGKTTNYLAVKMDVTQRKHAELEILDLNTNLELKIKERTKELASANQSLLNEMEIRNLAEKALLDSEERYRSVVENIKEVIFITDNDGLWIFLNKAWEEITGFSVNESIGKVFVEYVHPDDRARNWELFEPLIQRKKEYCRHEIRYLTKDGGFRWIEVFARLGINEQGETIGTYGTLRDITEWKQLSEFENELLQLSPKLTGISLSEIESSINLALTRIGNVLNADRSYVFEFSSNLQFMDNTYEWCNNDIQPQMKDLQNVPVDIFPEWMKKIQQGENIVIESVQDLPESWNTEREILEPQGIQSLLAIPLQTESKLIGFVGLDSVKSKRTYSATEINILKVWSNMLSSLISNKRTSELIEQTRQNYQTFFNTIDDFLIILDFTGKIIHANQTVYQRLGYSPEELLDMQILKLRPEERRPEAIKTFKRMMNGETDFCAIPLLTKSGVQIPIETHVKRGQWNGEERIFMVSKDISQIKLSEEKFSAAFQSNSAMMSIVSIESNQFIDVNQSFLDVLGYAREEVIGKSSKAIGLFSNPDQQKEFLEIFRNVQKVRKFEFDFETKQGDKRTGIISAVIIFLGTEMCSLSVVIDITERKAMELILTQAIEEAEKANAAKSEFLSRMSHELRTPMNSILGFAQLLEMSELNQGQKRGVSHILKSGHHLLDLINEVLDIARIEAGRISLSLEPIGLESIIHETVDIVKPQANSRQIQIEPIDSAASRLFVMSDRQRLKQILINLLNNAIKYNKDGGLVKIQCSLASPDLAGKPRIRIAISDTGHGISESDIPKLFTPFERIGAEKTTTEGTGLGLSVVKKLIEIMNGNLGVESLPNVGSTFWIELPETENQIQNAIKRGALELHQRGSTKKAGMILYVEDNVSNIELVEQILLAQRANIRLVTTMLGSQTVNLAVENKPDLILLDLNLPDIHGSKVLEHLLVNEKTSNIPVVVISADAMPQQLQRMTQAGAKDYLTKPLNVEEFIKVIDKYLPN